MIGVPGLVFWLDRRVCWRRFWLFSAPPPGRNLGVAPFSAFFGASPFETGQPRARASRSIELAQRLAAAAAPRYARRRCPRPLSLPGFCPDLLYLAEGAAHGCARRRRTKPWMNQRLQGIRRGIAASHYGSRRLRAGGTSAAQYAARRLQAGRGELWGLSAPACCLGGA